MVLSYVLFYLWNVGDYSDGQVWEVAFTQMACYMLITLRKFF